MAFSCGPVPLSIPRIFQAALGEANKAATATSHARSPSAATPCSATRFATTCSARPAARHGCFKRINSSGSTGRAQANSPRAINSVRSPPGLAGRGNHSKPRQDPRRPDQFVTAPSSGTRAQEGPHPVAKRPRVATSSTGEATRRIHTTRFPKLLLRSPNDWSSAARPEGA
jgi:hypothetical protein